MSQISITRKHRLGIKKARLAAEQVAADLEAEYGLSHAWDDDGVMRFERLGLHGHLALSRYEVTIEVTLGFFLIPFKPALEREIHEFFDRRFA